MSRKRLNESKRRFIEDVARLMIPWGVPPAAARLYGYLLLCSEPVSLDRMAADLEISKSSGSVAARLLERYMLARQLGERGSKRIFYEVSQSYEAILVGQNRMLDGFVELLRQGAANAASGAVRQRLEEMAVFNKTIRVAMDDALSRWRARKPR